MNYPDEYGNYIDDNKNSYFDFNEYIIYNLNQIKIKYITKVQFV